MGYVGLQPDTGQINVDRMGSHVIHFTPTRWDGATVDLTGFTPHLWLALPVANNPIPVAATLVTPGSGYSITTSQLTFEISEADLTAWQLNPGTYPGELLVSSDSGATTDAVWTGNLIVNNGWITNVF